LSLLLLAAVSGLLLYKESPGSWPGLVVQQTPPAHADEPPRFASGFVNEGNVPLVHASTAIVDPDGQLRSYWYGGSREGAGDVEIYTALFDDESGEWVQQTSAIERWAAISATNRYIRKLGAYSAINLAKSFDGGKTFTEHKPLIASPLLNRSNLVKYPIAELEDGTLALPVYFELHSKYSEILRLDKDGNVIGKQRISGEQESLQPHLLVGENLAVAIMRSGQHLDPGRTVLIATSNDRGRTWSETRGTQTPNPNSAVTGIRTSDGYIFVYNNQVSNRDQLSLGYAPTPDATWQEIHRLEFEKDTRSNEFRFSYPWLVHHGGDYHLFYTWTRRHIKHVRFNEAWLKQQRGSFGG
jgi:predicted neuraminidase